MRARIVGPWTYILLLLGWLMAVVVPSSAAGSQQHASSDSLRLRLARDLVMLLQPAQAAITMIERQAAAVGAGDVTLSAEVLAEVKADMDRLDEIVAGIYAKHLTVDELRGLIEFYGTPVGRRLTELQPVLGHEAMTASTELVMKLMGRVFDRTGIQVPPGT